LWNFHKFKQINVIFVFFRSSRKSYSNLAKGVGEIFGFFVGSIILGLEGVVLEELGVVLVEEEGCLGVEVVGEVGLVVSRGVIRNLLTGTPSGDYVL
jgi:hypothetical protein